MSYKTNQEICNVVRTDIDSSTTLAFGLPVMTTTERDLLSPATGDSIYNSTTTYVEVYNGSGWDQLAKV